MIQTPIRRRNSGISRRFCVCRAPALAGMLAGAALPALAADPAGIAAAVIGGIQVSHPERPAPAPVKSGMQMLVGDRVQSGADGRMQLLLTDQSVFTIGPNSDLLIDEFIFEESSDKTASGNSRLSATVTGGLLYYVSGKAAKENPDSVTIKTSSAILGVRGTALFVIDDPDSTDGTQFIGLLGPGNQNNGNLTEGGMTVSSGGSTTDVRRAGYGVFVTPGEAVGAPLPTPTRLVQAMALQLTTKLQTANAAGTDPDSRESQQSGATAPSGEAQGNLAVTNTGAASGQTTASAGIRAADVGQVVAALGAAAGSTGKATEGAKNKVVMEAAAVNAAGLLPLSVTIPAMIQLSWASFTDLDLDLHLSGPNPAGAGRFHIFSGNPGAYAPAPFAALDNNESGFSGSEVIGISQFIAGRYRVEVDGTDTLKGAVLAPDVLSGLGDRLRIRYVSGGRLERGPNGSTAAAGVELINFAPNAGQLGVTWTAFDIVHDGAAALKFETSNVISNSVAGAPP